MFSYTTELWKIKLNFEIHCYVELSTYECFTELAFSLFSFFHVFQGAWKPAWNISTVLTSIQLLMAEPNSDDPLVSEIVMNIAKYTIFNQYSNYIIVHLIYNGCFCSLFQSDEYKYNRPQFIKKAEEWTQKFAAGQKVSAASVKVLINFKQHVHNANRTK